MSMSVWVSLCRAAGIDVRNLELTEVYYIGGKILNDAEVTKLAIDAQLNRAVFPATAREDVLLAMTEAERAAVRERAVAGSSPVLRGKVSGRT